MIRYTLKADTKPLDKMIAHLDRIEREVQSIGKGVLSEIRDELYDELADEPPRRNYPQDYDNSKLDWTSERQRKAYWATDGFGAGIPFKRSGKMSRSWKITGKARGANFDIEVKNSSKGARYTVGTLSPDLRRAEQSQQGFHKRTGWELASPKVQYWLGVARSLFADQWQRRLAKVAGVTFSGRAYTKPSRRNR